MRSMRGSPETDKRGANHRQRLTGLYPLPFGNNDVGHKRDTRVRARTHSATIYSWVQPN